MERRKICCAHRIRGCFLLFLAFCSLGMAAAVGVSTNPEIMTMPNRPAITNASQLVSLSQNPDNRGYPVHLAVIVTYFDRYRYMFQCQDDSGHLYMPYFPELKAVKVGDYIEVEGVTILMGGDWSVDCKKINILKHGVFPKERVVGIKDLI